MSWRATAVPRIGSDHIDLLATSTALAWTDATSAVEEIFSGNKNRRRPADLTGRTQARITAAITVAGASGWTLALQYSVDSGANWAFLDGVDGPKNNVGTTTADTLVGSWTTIVAAARRDVLLRAVGSGGNGTTDPSVAQISVEVR